MNNQISLSVQNSNSNKIQRIAYILKQLGENIPDKFVLQNNKPFSFELQLKLEANQVISFKPKKTRKKETFIQLIEKDQDTLDGLATLFYLSAYGYNNKNVARKKIHILNPDAKITFSSLYSQYLTLVQKDK